MYHQHRPLSSKLAPASDPKAERQNETPPRDDQGRFTSPAADDLPEKYRGKSAAEIAEMHRNAEKELGRLRNEVGSYRGLVNDLTQFQRQAPEPTTVERAKIDVSSDDLLSDPSGTIDKVVNARLQEQQRSLEEREATAKLQAQWSQLQADFPDMDSIASSDEFIEFANRTGSRQYDLQVAATGSGPEQIRAARRLMEDFADFQSKPKRADNEPAKTEALSPTQRARAVSTEGAGPVGNIQSKPTIHESEVLKIIAEDPVRYRSPSFQRELTDAIREGRFLRS